jgi:hypothetical protein
MGDRFYRKPLFRIGFIINNGLKLAVTKVDGPRPGGDNSPAQAVQGNVTKMSFVDLHKNKCPTIALGGQAVELAGTTPAAIAVGKFEPLHPPINIITHKIYRPANLSTEMKADFASVDCERQLCAKLIRRQAPSGDPKPHAGSVNCAQPRERTNAQHFGGVGTLRPTVQNVS